MATRPSEKLAAAAGADFGDACRAGDGALVPELLALDGDRRIDIHAGNEEGFRAACANGHLHVVRELLALEGDRRIGGGGGLPVGMPVGPLRCGT